MANKKKNSTNEKTRKMLNFFKVSESITPQTILNKKKKKKNHQVNEQKTPQMKKTEK